MKEAVDNNNLSSFHPCLTHNSTTTSCIHVKEERERETKVATVLPFSLSLQLTIKG